MSATTTSIPRRHDLDALRAIAMLLGIALHAAIAFVPSQTEDGWPVQDTRLNEWYGVFMAMIHGFRMPLFFLISGFFTAMLWRKRGLRALLKHRFNRIFLPLVISFATIIPATWAAAIICGVVSNLGNGNFAEENKIHAAAIAGDLEAVKEHLIAGASPSDMDRGYGMTPLGLAVSGGHPEVVRYLLEEQQVDPDARMRDGSTALHLAAFFGRDETLLLLLQSGANPNVKDAKSLPAKSVLGTDINLVTFVAKLMRVEVELDEVKAGRAECAVHLAEFLAAADETKTLVAADNSESTPESQETYARAVTPAPKDDLMERLTGLGLLITMFPFFHHLWFLNFLCWLVLAFAAYAWMSNRFQWKGLPNWLVLSPARYAWLIPVTLVPQAFMGLLSPVFGPDTSAGILPMPTVLLYYAIFFFFGAAYFDVKDHDGIVGRRWWLTIPIALIIFPFGLGLATGRDDFGIATELRRPLAVLLQVMYAWLMTFGLMGVFRKFLSRESTTLRYLSDSSYWLYLAHLPLVMLAQLALKHVPLPSFVKFTLICTVVTAFLLFTYQMFVRYTMIGTLLNGPRKRTFDAVAVDPVLT